MSAHQRHAIHGKHGAATQPLQPPMDDKDGGYWLHAILHEVVPPTKTSSTLLQSAHNRTTRAWSFDRTAPFSSDHHVPVLPSAQQEGAAPTAQAASRSRRTNAPTFHTAGATTTTTATTTATPTATAAATATASVPPKRARSIYDFDAMVASRKDPFPPRVDHTRPPHVLIIGAGLAGLCLAQGLKQRGITFTVFERDPAPHCTSQGYRVHIDEPAYDALKALLPLDLFERFLQSAGEVFPAVVYRNAHTGEALRIDQGLKATQRVFSVDRAMLRSLLLAGLEDGKEIQFDAEFKRFHVLPNGLVEIHFENGCFMQGTMLVGADGPMSRVRLQYLPGRLPILDTECAAIYGKTRITSDLRELGLAASCTTLVLSEHPRMALVIEPENATRLAVEQFVSPFGDTNPELVALHQYISWVLLTRIDIFEDDDDLGVHELYAMSPEEVAAVAVHLTTDWHPAVRTIVDLQAREWTSFTKVSTTEPHLPAWPASVVTLLGDAVHTMVPSGRACGAALRDAHDLCDEFALRGVTIAAVAAYETRMRARASQQIQQSIVSGRELYGLPPLRDMKVATWES